MRRKSTAAPPETAHGMISIKPRRRTAQGRISMKVFCIQPQIKPEETKQEKIERFASILDRCREADVVVMPETWNTGSYSFEKLVSQAEPADGPSQSMVREKARAINAYIAGSIVEKGPDGRLRNTLRFISPEGKDIAVYCKRHLVTFGSPESEIMTPGTESVTVDTDFGRFGFTICYDIRFPEHFRELMIKNADFILSPVAWVYPRVDQYRLLHRARAIENVCYVFSSNFVGCEGGKMYFGSGMGIDPWGHVMATNEYDETIIKSEAFASEITRIRADFKPVEDRLRIYPPEK